MSQKIWIDDISCASSTYDCIANCASCPSAEYHNCDHSEDVTIECGKYCIIPVSQLNAVLHYIVISSSLLLSDITTSTCDDDSSNTHGN